jgi:polyferredoxin
VLSCHSCALSWFACPIGVFVHYAGYRVFPFFALGTVVLLAVFLGRMLCGWMCPFGLIQDWLQKIPSPKRRLPSSLTRIKYGVLLVTVLIIPFLLGAETPYSFCRVCPASALQVTLPNLVSGGVSALGGANILKLALLLAILGLTVVFSRFFCRVLCPLGALLAPFNAFSYFKVKVPPGDCVFCARCNRICPVDAQPAARIVRGEAPSRSPECIGCNECRTQCINR